jgi:hypothetical protein
VKCCVTNNFGNKVFSLKLESNLTLKHYALLGYVVFLGNFYQHFWRVVAFMSFPFIYNAVSFL